MRIETHNSELKGSNIDIGRMIGGKIAGHLPAEIYSEHENSKMDETELMLAHQMFEGWCPGLNDEIRGMAEFLGVDARKMRFYSMTSLKPRCSQIVMLPGKTQNGHVLMARSYEFSHRMEDFCLVKTSVAGKNTHLGTSVMLLGRDEGLNEHGLGVTMSSCGFPVGAMEGMRKPALRGLMYWAVIRSLLENCRNVDEGLSILKDMPIAYNINLLLADRGGKAALFETMDGKKACRTINSDSSEGSLFATNHIVLNELKHLEPGPMPHSICRFEKIRQFMKDHLKISIDQLKELLLTEYPDGLCAHYYDEFFGTTKSIIFDLTEGTLEICWGGLAANGWKKYQVAHPLNEGAHPIEIIPRKAPAGIF